MISIWEYIERENEETIEAIDTDDEVNDEIIDDEIGDDGKNRTRASRRNAKRNEYKRMVRELGLKYIVPDADKRKMIVRSKKVAEFNNSVRRYNCRPKDTKSVRRYMSGEWYADVDSVSLTDASIEEPEEQLFFTEWNVLVAVAHLRDEVYSDEVRSTTDYYQWWEVTKSLLNMISEHSLKIWRSEDEVVFTAIKPLNGDMARFLVEILKVFKMWS